jgi:NADH-quinone oxidoreductase subunit L
MQWPVSLFAILSLWIFFAWNPFGPGSWLAHFRGTGNVYLSQWSVIFEYAGVITWLSIGWTALALLLAWWLFTKKEAHATEARYTLDDLYNQGILAPALRTSDSFARFDKHGIDRFLHLFVYSQVTIAKVAGFIDRYVVDGTVTAVVWVTRATGNLLRTSPGTNIQSYLVWSAIALIIFIFWLLK